MFIYYAFDITCQNLTVLTLLWEKENLFNRLNKNDSLAYEVVFSPVFCSVPEKNQCNSMRKVHLGWLKQSKSKSIKLPIKVFYNSGLFYGGANYLNTCSTLTQIRGLHGL